MMGNATKGYVDERLKEVSGGVTPAEFNDLYEYVHEDVVAAINNNASGVSDAMNMISELDNEIKTKKLDVSPNDGHHVIIDDQGTLNQRIYFNNPNSPVEIKPAYSNPPSGARRYLDVTQDIHVPKGYVGDLFDDVSNLNQQLNDLLKVEVIRTSGGNVNAGATRMEAINIQRDGYTPISIIPHVPSSADSHNIDYFICEDANRKLILNDTNKWTGGAIAFCDYITVAYLKS